MPSIGSNAIAPAWGWPDAVLACVLAICFWAVIARAVRRMPGHAPVGIGLMLALTVTLLVRAQPVGQVVVAVAAVALTLVAYSPVRPFVRAHDDHRDRIVPPRGATGFALLRGFWEGPGVIVLRVLTVDDWQQWKDLRLAALADAPEAFHSRLVDWIGATELQWRDRLEVPGRYLVADLDGRPAGMVCGPPPDATGVADLLSLWVAPCARGRGVGDALVGAVIDWAAELGAARVALHVVEGNDAASRLYLRHGFVDHGRVPGIGGMVERRMERVLVGSPVVGG